MKSRDNRNMIKKDPITLLGTFLDQDPLFKEHLSILSHTLQWFRDPRTGSDEITSVLKIYPTLSANIVKLSNSPYFGAQQKLSTVGQAAAVLGARYFGSAVATSTVEALFCAHGSANGYHQKLWRHSFTTAVLARQIARVLVTEIESEEAYITGLLHDLGKFVLLALHPDKYGEMSQEIDNDTALLKEEEMTFGIMHPEIGGILVQKCLSDERIAWGILLQHNPLRLSSLSGIVNMANTLASGDGASLDSIDEVRPLIEKLDLKELQDKGITEYCLPLDDLQLMHAKTN